MVRTVAVGSCENWGLKAIIRPDSFIYHNSPAYHHIDMPLTSMWLPETASFTWQMKSFFEMAGKKSLNRQLSIDYHREKWGATLGACGTAEER